MGVPPFLLTHAGFFELTAPSLQRTTTHHSVRLDPFRDKVTLAIFGGSEQLVELRITP